MLKALVTGFGKMGMLHAATLSSFDALDEVIVSDSSHFVREGLKTFNPGSPRVEAPARARRADT